MCRGKFQELYINQLSMHSLSRGKAYLRMVKFDPSSFSREWSQEGSEAGWFHLKEACCIAAVDDHSAHARSCLPGSIHSMRK